MTEDFFQKVLKLKTIPRQGWKDKLGINDPESVAEHSYSVSAISMILSDLKGLDTEQIIRMALLHDLSESVIGDITPDAMTKDEKNRKENLAMKQILENLPDRIAERYFNVWNDYQKNSSKEANLMHDIDKLEMALQAKFYENRKIPKEKLQTFFNTAKNQIKDKDLRAILMDFIE